MTIMTEYIPKTFNEFASEACNNCSNDWYCSGHCDTLLKAEEMPFGKLQKAYKRHDGEWAKIWNYIRRAGKGEIQWLK